ncbi:MAG: outer membrane protein assembly factor BamD [Phycisphaerae bacterium]|nr:outer membrane protein assembly factor BamD [Phycisphaerae bacterium]
MITSPNRIAAGCAVLLLVSSCSSVAEGGFEWRTGKWVRSPAATKVSPAGQLAIIRQLIDNGHNAKAVKGAKAFIKKYPQHDHCQEAMMLAGEGELARARYYQAFQWFEKQLARFPTGKHFQRALDREFKVAEAFLAGKKRIVWGFVRLPSKDEGLEILSRIAEHAPSSAIAAKAMMRIGDYHYNADHYAEAVNAYDEYLAMFKKSPGAAHAMLQAARATQAQFAGIRFDETPLIDAEQRFKAFAERFPQAAEKENISKILDQIADTLAEKLYACGEYYVRTGKPSAAAFYYKQVVDRYGRTSWARYARQSLNGLAHIKPVRPSGKFMLLNPSRPTTRPSRPAAGSAGSSPPSGSAAAARQSRIKR